MKVRAYVLFVAVALLAVSAGTKNAKPTVGINPGDFAPRIESLGTESNFSFQNHSGRYTLLNFWATYDAESRARNVQQVEFRQDCDVFDLFGRERIHFY